MIGGRSAETIRVVRDRIDDCKQPRCRNVKITLAAAGPSIDVSGLLMRLRPQALMGTVDRDLIKLTGSRCPLTQSRSLSIRR